MKFMMHLTPAVPATPEERERLAPIAHHTDKIQELLEESVLSYRPGTRSAWPKILPGLGQKYGVEPGNIGPEAELRNREVFQELFEIMKLLERRTLLFQWQILPSPVPGRRTRVAGSRGDSTLRCARRSRRKRVAAQDLARSQAVSEATSALVSSSDHQRRNHPLGGPRRHCATFPDLVIKGAKFYADAANEAGQNLKIGQNIGLARLMYIEEAMTDQSFCSAGFTPNLRQKSRPRSSHSSMLASPLSVRLMM